MPLYTFQTPRMYKNKVMYINPKVSYEFWVIMIFQCGLISCNKCTTLGVDADNAGSYACGGQTGVWKYCTCLSILLGT